MRASLLLSTLACSGLSLCYSTPPIMVLRTMGSIDTNNNDYAKLKSSQLEERICPGFTYCMRLHFNILNGGQIFGYPNNMLRFRTSWPNFFFQSVLRSNNYFYISVIFSAFCQLPGWWTFNGTLWPGIMFAWGLMQLGCIWILGPTTVFLQNNSWAIIQFLEGK